MRVLGIGILSFDFDAAVAVGLRAATFFFFFLVKVDALLFSIFLGLACKQILTLKTHFNNLRRHTQQYISSAKRCGRAAQV